MLILALTPVLIVPRWEGAVAGGFIAIVIWIIMSIYGDRILLKTLRAEKLDVGKYHEIAKLVSTMRAGPGLGPPA